jgi:hypothetical protein
MLVWMHDMLLPLNKRRSVAAHQGAEASLQEDCRPGEQHKPGMSLQY